VSAALKRVWTLAQRELGSLLNHPTGYVLLVVFLGVNNFLYFRSAYLSGMATLRPMLDLLPWILLFFVPAVTMRTVAEDARSGTLEVVLAQPVTELELVVGKYLGALSFILLALALTLPIPLALSLGADLPAGVIVAQYVGAGLLAAGVTAVGVWASSITKNQITAFIVGVAVMFLLILAGASPLLTGLPPGLASLVARLSVLPHFESIARGLIDLRDVVYFVTLAGLFIAFAYLSVMGRKLSPTRAARRRLRLGTALVAATLVVVNLFGQHIGGRLDLTPGKAYTLSPATRQILGGLDDLVTIKFFVSRSLPPEITVVKRDITDLLGDMRGAGRGAVRVVELDPAEDPEVMTEARSLGIPPIRFNVVGESELQVQEGYMGIAVLYADGVETIPLVQRTDDLEYRLVTGIRSLTSTGRAVIGLLESTADAGGDNSYNILRRELEANYEVRAITATDSVPISDDIRVVVLAGVAPVILDTPQVARFERFFERGGGALVMASGMALQPQGFMAAARPVGWNQVMRSYGVAINGDIVFDLASNEAVAMPSAMGRVMMSYPFWLRGLSTRAATINYEMDAMLFPWASSVDTSGAAPGTVTPLFTTSRSAGREVGRAMVDPQRSWPQDSLGTQVLAVLVNPLAADSAVGLRGRLVVVGNGDFVADRYALNAPAGILFALNAVDWLAQDEALIQIRSKDRRPPPLVFESDAARDFVKYVNLVGVPLLLILFAAAHLWRRRLRTRRSYTPAGAA
jgi:ABC-type uncharacterized transport system involved in gliding motility auxiliary subunit/ABC-type transport system involved in multi-copper enzyme maturation permease subunit